MLAKAKTALLGDSDGHVAGRPKYTFAQGSAENMRAAVPEDGSVDLLIAGTCICALSLIVAFN